MISDQKKQYIFGGTVIFAVMLLIISVFFLMSRTHLTDVSMDPCEEMGWKYELISDSGSKPAAPVMIDNYTVSFPGESCRAIKASRVIKEALETAQIGIYLYNVSCGVDILLDGEMIYTSFVGAERDESGLALTDGFAPAPSETVETFLPEDYLNRNLTVITYFPSETDNIVPLFPYLCNPETMFAVTSVENVPPVSRATVCAILAFITALIYVLDISNGKADKRILLLTLFYSMFFIDQVFSSLAGSYSLMRERFNMLDFICELYIAPLLMFAALSLTSWRKWILAAATGVWFTADAVKLIRSRLLYGPFYGKASATVILLLYILALAMIITEMRIKRIRPSKKSCIIYAIAAAFAAATRVIMMSAEWDWDVGMYLQQLVVNPLQGYFYPLALFVSYVCAVTVTAAVIIEFVKRTFRTRELINALEDQNRRAMESYKRMAESEEATYSVRHEMRHHMIALSGMLRDGETDRAREYIAAVTDEYDELPNGQYSKNVMVNIIAGTYLERAKARGIEVKHSLSLPETLPIADTDLCVFLTNMFENALNSCEKVTGRKYIRTKMYINGSYLFIGCKNSLPQSETESKKDRFHGYSLENMRRIAEKYDGALKIDRDESSFCVKSDFRLTKEN